MSKLKNLNIEYANFLCHFGEHVLLDRYAELFYPAINSGKQRKYGTTTYSLHDLKHIALTKSESSEKEYFLFGKIVKDFIYEREQLLDREENELVKDHDELRDCPSSTFILCLTDHRLYFIKEFQLGPTLDNLKSLVEHLIKSFINELVDDEYRSKREMSRLTGGRTKSVTKTKLRVNYPLPDIKIIKLSSPEGIEEFIKSMKTIEKFELTINRTNHESDLSSLFRTLRDQTKEIGAGASNKITYSKGKSSLNHDKVTEIAKEASSDNNINFSVKGKGLENQPMGGTEEEFTVKVPISEVEETPELMTKKAFEYFWKLIGDGIIKQPRIENLKDVRRKIKNIFELIK